MPMRPAVSAARMSRSERIIEAPWSVATGGV
jgi:hypothetical protein